MPGRARRSPGASSAFPRRPSTTLGDVDGLDVVELGCGTAYVSAWLARRGARPVGVDVTPAQLATARRCQEEFGLAFPLVEASAEDVPLPSESFDLAVSEYGASIWCDPHRWLPEAYRLLRPGGRLWFLRNSTLSILCAPDEEGPPGDDAAPSAARAWGAWSGPARSASSGSSRTASSSACCDARASTSSTSSSSTRPTTPATTSTTRRSRPSGRGKWPAEEIWVAAQAAVTPTLVLASTSPQRRAILEQLRIPFEVEAPSYVEHDPPDADPVDARSRPRGRQGALGPPRRLRDARRRHDGAPRRARLRQGRRRARRRRRCSASSRGGRTRCSPASASSTGREEDVEHAETLVTFRPLADGRARGATSRAASGRGGRAAYAIQGLGGRLVERIDGDYLNVVGLPGALLVELLTERAPGLLG